MNKVVLNESEQRKVVSITEEFKTRGGKMSTEELISRLDAIPFEEFMSEMSEKILNYKDDNICK